MASSLYKGWVRHRRSAPAGNSFRYGLFMVYADLADLPALFDPYWLWSARRPALAWFRREDYLGPADLTLDEAVRRRVEAETGRRPVGPIRMLTHLRYFGVVMNPVTFYYCFDAEGSRLETLVAEITNTPWDQRHSYVLPRSDATLEGQSLRWRFGKSFHVSPFMPMDMDYDWRFNEPSEALLVHMQNLRDGELVFDATLNLHREPVSSGSLARALALFPMVTIKVAVLIYWQAFKLLLKRVPFFTHPDKLPARKDER